MPLPIQPLEPEDPFDTHINETMRSLLEHERQLRENRPVTVRENMLNTTQAHYPRIMSRGAGHVIDEIGPYTTSTSPHPMMDCPAIDLCHSCGLQATPEREGFKWEQDYLWCDACHTNTFFACRTCRTYHKRRNASRWGCDGSPQYCNDCQNMMSYNSCENCNNYFEEDSEEWLDSGVEGYCGNCQEIAEEREDISFHSPVFKDTFITTTKGKIVASVRPVGVELEVEYKKKKDALTAQKGLPKEVGIGTDGSIQGMGLELRFPPASGKKLEEMVEKTCDVLKANNFVVNPSCGFHIHMDMEDLATKDPVMQLNALKMIWCMYLTFEDVITSFLPHTRRAEGDNGKRYCQSLRSEYSIQEVLNCVNRDELERLWYRVKHIKHLNEAKADTRHATRYRGINFHPYWREGHMEIRYHTGTIRPEKILHWANLHTLVLDKSIAINLNNDMIRWMKEICNSLDMSYKTQKFFSFLGLSPLATGYYLARQHKFKKAEPKNESNTSFESGMKILSEEPEI